MHPDRSSSSPPLLRWGQSMRQLLLLLFFLLERVENAVQPVWRTPITERRFAPPLLKRSSAPYYTRPEDFRVPSYLPPSHNQVQPPNGLRPSTFPQQQQYPQRFPQFPHAPPRPYPQAYQPRSPQYYQQRPPAPQYQQGRFPNGWIYWNGAIIPPEAIPYLQGAAPVPPQGAFGPSPPTAPSPMSPGVRPETFTGTVPMSPSASPTTTSQESSTSSPYREASTVPTLPSTAQTTEEAVEYPTPSVIPKESTMSSLFTAQKNPFSSTSVTETGYEQPVENSTSQTEVPTFELVTETSETTTEVTASSQPEYFPRPVSAQSYQPSKGPEIVEKLNVNILHPPCSGNQCFDKNKVSVYSPPKGPKFLISNAAKGQVDLPRPSVPEQKYLPYAPHLSTPLRPIETPQGGPRVFMPPNEFSLPPFEQPTPPLPSSEIPYSPTARTLPPQESEYEASPPSAPPPSPPSYTPTGEDVTPPVPDYNRGPGSTFGPEEYATTASPRLPLWATTTPSEETFSPTYRPVHSSVTPESPTPPSGRIPGRESIPPSSFGRTPGGPTPPTVRPFSPGSTTEETPFTPPSSEDIPPTGGSPPTGETPQHPEGPQTVPPTGPFPPESPFGPSTILPSGPFGSEKPGTPPMTPSGPQRPSTPTPPRETPRTPGGPTSPGRETIPPRRPTAPGGSEVPLIPPGRETTPPGGSSEQPWTPSGPPTSPEGPATPRRPFGETPRIPEGPNTPGGPPPERGTVPPGGPGQNTEQPRIPSGPPTSPGLPRRPFGETPRVPEGPGRGTVPPRGPQKETTPPRPRTPGGPPIGSETIPPRHPQLPPGRPTSPPGSQETNNRPKGPKELVTPRGPFTPSPRVPETPSNFPENPTSPQKETTPYFTSETLTTPSPYSPMPRKGVQNRLRAGKVRVVCQEDGIKFIATSVLPFTGEIFANDRKRIPVCFHTFQKTIMPTAFLPFKECGVKNAVDQQNNQTQYHMQVVVIVKQEDGSTTVQSYMTQCVHQKIQYNKQSLPRRIEEALEELRLVPIKLEQKALLPLVEMRLLVDEHDRIGPEVAAVDIGMPLALHWSLKNESSAYGFHVKSCAVADTISGMDMVVIDEQGCSTDTTIMAHPHYDTYHDSASSHMWAFKVPDHSKLRLSCEIAICTDLAPNGSNQSSCSSIPTPPFCPDLITSPSNSILFDKGGRLLKRRREIDSTEEIQTVRAVICTSDTCRRDYVALPHCVDVRWLAASSAFSGSLFILSVVVNLALRCKVSRERIHENGRF